MWKLVLILSVVFYSCNKKDIVKGTSSQVKLINGSPNSGSIDLLQNLKPVGQITYLTGINPTVTNLTIDSGFNNYRLKKGTDEIANWLFANEGLNLSFFVCDSMIPSKVKYFFLMDNLDTTGLGKNSKIRFVHTSPDIDTVDLVTNRPSNLTQDSAVISNKDYSGKHSQSEILTASAFQNFYADSVVTIKIRKKSNSSILKQYQFNFKKGIIYSLLLKGYAARAGNDSLSLSIIQHN